jgi:hypothetical protein
LRLRPEAPEESVVLGERCVQNFHRHPTPEPNVVSQKHLG